ncbi:MAG: peroxide stress protein YaaA [Candidatus Bathyarchaeia archaeon]
MLLNNQRRLLILIPCCKKKEHNSGKSYRQVPVMPKHLDMFSDSLVSCRREIAITLHLSPGPDLGFATPTQVLYMPAFKRYIGNLYSRISEESWQKLNNSRFVSLVIVSALYGLLTWFEPTRDYNCTMNDRLPDGSTLWAWWMHKGLGVLVADYVKSNGINVVHDFLSIPYRKAVEGVEKHVGNNVKYVNHEYPGLGSGSNFHRGEEVNKLIRECCN